MANEAVQGLFKELGLQSPNEDALLQNFIKKQAPQGGTNAALFAQLGSANAGLVGEGLTALAGGVKGLVRPEAGQKRGLGSFAAGASRAVRGLKENVAAQETGVTLEQYKRRKQSSIDAGNVKVVPTGDPIKDQLTALEQIIRIASLNGDTELMSKAMAKRQQLRTQAAALNKVVLGNETTQQKLDQKESEAKQTALTGIDVVREGSDPTDKNFRPSSAIFNPLAGPLGPDGEPVGAWKIFHPDGSVEENADHIQKHVVAPRNRLGEGIIQSAIRQVGTAKTFGQARIAVLNMEKNIRLATSATDILIAMVDPNAPLALAGDAVIAISQGVQVVESLGALAFGASGDGTYQGKNGVVLKNSDIAYRGVKVASASAQHAMFLKDAGAVIEEAGGILSFAPPHLRDQLRETAVAAARFKAVIMEMAFMDARMQEPSNRGLSDKDIEAALLRIGAFSAEPVAFIQRQIDLAVRNRNMISELGREFTPDGIWTKQELIDAVYDPDLMGSIIDEHNSVIVKLQDAKRRVIDTQQGAPDQTGPDRVGAPRADVGQTSAPKSEAELLEDGQAALNELLGIG